MRKQKPGGGVTVHALRRVALRHPEVEEGIACKGTALESAGFKTRGKVSLLLRTADARPKLGKSQGDAANLAAQNPQRWRVGAQGWTTVNLRNGDTLLRGVTIVDGRAITVIDGGGRRQARARPGRVCSGCS